MNTLKERKIALIACRVLSIYILIQGIAYGSSYVSMSVLSRTYQTFDKSLIYQTLLISLVPLVILLVLAGVLWIKAEGVSKFIIPYEATEEHDSPIDIENLQTAALAIVGIIIVVKVVPEFIGQIPKLLGLKNNPMIVDSFYKTEITYSILEKTIRLTLGLLLTLKGRGVIGAIKSLQKAGLNNIDE